MISDVINDELDIIASGPTVPPCLSKLTAKEILDKYELLHLVPDEVDLNAIPEIPKEIFDNVHNLIFSSNSLALNEAEKIAKQVFQQNSIFKYLDKNHLHNNFFSWVL